jgi:biopolymer transport protein ExbD
VNLVVTADADVPHGRVVHVIDLAKLEGIAKFAIHVEREK